MQPSHSYSVPNWVRSTICLTACLSVPGLILAACAGVQVGIPVSFVVGACALRTIGYAFRDSSGSGGPPLLRFLSEAYRSIQDERHKGSLQRRNKSGSCNTSGSPTAEQGVLTKDYS